MKDYSCKKTSKPKPSDFYETPYSLTRILMEEEKFKGSILEPACGDLAIVKVLEDAGRFVFYGDIKTGVNFLSAKFYKHNIITNPPYSLADEFVLKAKEICRDKFAFLLRMNYMNAQKRTKLKLFDNLKKIITFNRMPDLSHPIRKDGKFKTGMQTYGWYIWQKNYTGPIELKIVDVSMYVAKKNEIDV